MFVFANDFVFVAENKSDLRMRIECFDYEKRSESECQKD